MGRSGTPATTTMCWMDRQKTAAQTQGTGPLSLSAGVSDDGEKKYIKRKSFKKDSHIVFLLPPLTYTHPMKDHRASEHRELCHYE